MHEEKKSGSGAGSSGRKGAVKKEKKLSYTTNLESGQQDLLSNLDLRFSDSLVSFDENLLHFTDTAFNPAGGYSIIRDTTGKIVSLKYPWKEEQEFRLVLEKDIAKDSSGLGLAKSDTLRFKTRPRADYGALKLRIRNLDTAQHVVLLFFSGDKIADAIPVNISQINIPLFHTGDYEIRILYDKNSNRKWDPGSYTQKKQPEKIVVDGKKYNIRANWDNEITIELPKAPPPDILP